MGLAAGVAVALLGAAVLTHADEEVYAFPGWGVTLTLVLLVVGLGGALAIGWARRASLSAGVLVASALLVFGVLAILSVGVLALLTGAGLLAWTLRRAPGSRRLAAIGGAALAGAVLPVLLVIALSGPVVECDGEGASAGENLFMSLGGGGGESEIFDALDRSGGSARGGNYEYTFSCVGERLAEFDLRWR